MLPPDCPEAVTEAAPQEKGGVPLQKKARNRWVPPSDVRSRGIWERERVSETTTETLQYRFDGPEDAPILVLGPSLGTSWHMWDRQIPELTDHWRVFRYDLPGHGGAPAHPATAVADLSDRLLATLDGVGVQRFGYAGCSIGGAIGADLALRHPQRVASLALVAASPRFGSADEFRQRGVVVRTNGLEPMARTAPERWFTPASPPPSSAIVDWAVQMVRTTDPGCYIAACEALAAFDVRGELGRIGAPTLVLVGAEDRVTGPGDARVLVSRHTGRPARPRTRRLPSRPGRAARRRHRSAAHPLLLGLAGHPRRHPRPGRHPTALRTRAARRGDHRRHSAARPGSRRTPRPARARHEGAP